MNTLTIQSPSSGNILKLQNVLIEEVKITPIHEDGVAVININYNEFDCQRHRTNIISIPLDSFDVTIHLKAKNIKLS